MADCKMCEEELRPSEAVLCKTCSQTMREALPSLEQSQVAARLIETLRKPNKKARVKRAATAR